MSAPAQAARTKIQSGTTSDFGTGSGIAVTKTSEILGVPSNGFPMYGSLVMAPVAIVDSFTSLSPPSCWKTLKTLENLKITSGR